jgi:hypothetical protein
MALLGGILVGRPWVVVVAAAAWPATVALLGDCAGWCLLEAAGLGAANAALGVMLRRGAEAVLARR